MQGSELKAIREALGMGQRAFADALGMTQTYVSQMEQDKRTIERRTEMAARYLGLPGGPDDIERAETAAWNALLAQDCGARPEDGSVSGAVDLKPVVRAIAHALIHPSS